MKAAGSIGPGSRSSGSGIRIPDSGCRIQA